MGVIVGDLNPIRISNQQNVVHRSTALLISPMQLDIFDPSNSGLFLSVAIKNENAIAFYV